MKAVEQAVAAAEAILPGEAAREGEQDPRWQAIIAVGEFIETEPDAVWTFVRKWGASPDDDLRAAIATCLLEHLLEHHFDEFIARVEQAARSSPFFGETVKTCWMFGESLEPANVARFKKLVASLGTRD